MRYHGSIPHSIDRSPFVKPKAGETVRVHYTGTLEDESEFDSSKGRAPIEFAIGGGTVIPGFEAAVADLEVGGSMTVVIPADEAYGPRFEEAIQRVPLEAFADAGVPQAGWMVQVHSPDGEEMNALIAEVGDEEVVLDFNHPLAGKDLTFELNLVEIVGR
jgi:peptidylprolyl isomerase